MNTETKICQNCKKEFRIDPEDFAFYEKMAVPGPTWCPECRVIRRMSWRNERQLFRKKDDHTGEEILTWLSPGSPYKIYDKDYWWSDAWDAFAYGRDYDFSRPFFLQLAGLFQEVPWASKNVVNNVNCDFANNLGNSKNCYLCFDLDYAEDSAYLINAYYNRNCFDIATSFAGELNYDSILVDNCFQTFFSFACESCRNVWFSRNLTGCSDCFGCVNLRNKQYHIFNKPYTKEEYHALREKIVRHMEEMPYTDPKGRIYRYGEFFPPEFSPFAYNETIAQDFFPLTKETAEERGFIWREEKVREYQTTVAARDLPDHISDAPDAVIKEIIACASCGRAYRIIQMELDFLRRMGLPLPRACPNCRFAARTRYRNSPKFYQRRCQCTGTGSSDGRYANTIGHAHGAAPCSNTFMTSYAVERKEIIYCEQCYQTEVV